MSFNKRYINKSNILFYIKNKDITSVVRGMKIDMLFNADALIMDGWSSRFYHDLNPVEREIRKSMCDKYKFDSSTSGFLSDDDYKNLTSLSETLLSLLSESPQWIDIHVAIEKLNIKVEDNEAGRSEILREKCINAIIEYFDRP